MKRLSLTLDQINQLAGGANPDYITGLRNRDAEEIITALALDCQAAMVAMNKANETARRATLFIERMPVVKPIELKRLTVAQVGRESGHCLDYCEGWVSAMDLALREIAISGNKLAGGE